MVGPRDSRAGSARHLSLGLTILLLTGVLTAGDASAQGPPVTFMEPVDAQAQDAQLPLYHRIEDPDRLRTYSGWLENEPARSALELYLQAIQVARRRPVLAPTTEGLQTLYIALIPEGNHADVGFKLQGADGGITEHPSLPYIKLGPEAFWFTITLLHETGHVAMYLLTGGIEIPGRDLTSIPHSTAALSDRGTAFSEGFAIHLETLAAHFGTETWLKNRYRHEQLLFGKQRGFLAEYYRQTSDLMNYAQTRARYDEVRENSFAFAPAHREPDYLRVQLDKARDFSALRDANQLLQSEGFYATFFFSLMARGSRKPDAEMLRQRQARILEALADVMEADPPQPDTPYLLDFVEAYLSRFPDAAGEVVDVLLDLSHGVFVDPAAAELWRSYYRAALSLDLATLRSGDLEEARQRWREMVSREPGTLRSRLGPQIRCQAEGPTVRLVALGAESPLIFDLNTAHEGVLRMIPAITDAEVERWMTARGARPFSGLADFQTRAKLSDAVWETLSCG